MFHRLINDKALQCGALLYLLKSKIELSQRPLRACTAKILLGSSCTKNARRQHYRAKRQLSNCLAVAIMVSMSFTKNYR
ncbi:hypothetical protein F8Y91_08550 [Vibrio alginolyticus]|nr:hypothetical protein [Vibrio alginolyticus]